VGNCVSYFVYQQFLDHFFGCVGIICGHHISSLQAVRDEELVFLIVFNEHTQGNEGLVQGG
jgi:hypothetical protein